MNSELLYLFAHVAGTSCITSSAETLGMSRPALSMRIRQLECEIGVQLFQRVGRGIQITEAGRRLLVYAKDVDRVLKEASTAMREYASNQASVLSVATGRTSGDLDTPLWLQQFQKNHPEVSVRTLICNTTETVEHVLTGLAELGVVGNPPDNPLLTQEYLYDEMLDVVCSPSLIGGTKALKSNMLRKLDTILVREKNSGTRGLAEAWLAEQNVNPAHWIELRSEEALRHSAILGIGFAFLPVRLIREELQNKTLISLLGGKAPIRMRSCILYSTKKGLSEIGRAFADLVTEYYRNLAA